MTTQKKSVKAKRTANVPLMFYLTPESVAALRKYRQDHGVPVAFAVRRAVAEYLARQEVRG